MGSDGRQAVVQEWQAAAPRTDAEVGRFYQESACLADDLRDWHQTPDRQALTRALVAFAQEHGVRSVLDVGCGRGDDLRALWDAGFHDLSGVEPNVALRATMPYLIRCGVVNDLTEFSPRQQFGLTILIDVLEHLPNPQAFLDRVLRHVPIGGYLAECTGTWDTETPLHLPANWGWRPTGQIRRAGFEVVHQTSRLTFYQRVADGVQPMQSVLMCVWRSTSLATTRCLWDLSRQGLGRPYDPDGPLVYNLLTRPGDADIGRSRAIIVSDWWRDMPDDVFLMLDDDIVFNPASADRLVRLARAKRSVACAAYATKGGAHFACQMFPGQQVTFAPDAAPAPIRYAATGFMAVHRDVIDALIPTLPIVHPDEPWSYWPLFQQFSREYVAPRWPGDPGKLEGLSEDFAFCARARDLGFEIWLDPSIYLEHEGTRLYTPADVFDRIRAGETKYFQLQPDREPVPA